jgi:CIC family chloride channel protein
LFIGATLGAAFAAGVHAVLPGVQVSVVSAAVIGMACMVGASTGAAVTAVVMIFEMTRDYHVIIPLIIAVSVAYSMRRLLLRDTIYTLKLTRRGQRIPDAIQSPLYLARDALEFIRVPYVCLDADAALAVAMAHRRRLRKTPRVVLLDGGELVGIVPARAVRAACRGMPADTPLRSLADTRVVVVKGSIQVFDLIAVLREKRLRNAVMTRDGTFAGVDSILGVVTWEDLVESTNLSGSMERDGNVAT